MSRLRRKIKDAKKVVVKIGSAVIAGGDMDSIARDISLLIDAGREVVLVSSGSVAMGMKKLKLKERPSTIPELQAVAALGQIDLMVRYESAFAKNNKNVAQVLLTHDDLGDRKRFLNARNTITTLLKMGILPIVNENDTTAVDEIKWGDNDELSALTMNLFEADIQVILTDIEGICDKDPKIHQDSKRISEVCDIDSLKIGLADSSAGYYGTGGMTSKVSSANIAAHLGTSTVIADGLKSGTLTKVFDGADIGTIVASKDDSLTSKKHWIAYSTRPTGRVFLDSGARLAVLENGRSLLASGITKVDGLFDSGEVVHCVDSSGVEFARGVVNYSSSEIDEIKGLKSAEIFDVLGFKDFDEVIHRNNLVLIKP